MAKNTDKILAKVLQLHSLYQSGAIARLAQHEVHPDLDTGSMENYLYFTLPPCINFQRNSPAMWRSALATWEDSKTRYLFLPEEVFRQARDKVQRDLLKYKLALQPNKHTDIWIAISRTLHQFFQDDPRKLLASANCDVGKILRLIQKDRKKDFTHLSGPKMTNYWLYILSQYTDVKLASMEEISIIPDTHVLQCSVKLGIADENTTSIQVAELWKELLRGSGIAPVQMHPVLWNWSRAGFIPAI